MATKSFTISASGLKNIVLTSESDPFSILNSISNIRINDEEFLFIFGEKGIKMNRIFAEFISPRVFSLHKSDPTINTFHINLLPNDQNIDLDHKILEKLALVSIGETVDIDSNDSLRLRILSRYLGNTEIFDKMNELFPIQSRETNVDKCIQYLKYYDSLKTIFSIDDEEIIKNISRNFYTIDTRKLMNLPYQVIYSILSSNELKLDDENSLFDFIQILFAQNQNNEIDKTSFYELIDVSSLSYDKFIEFIKEIDPNEMTGEIWSQIKDTIIMNKKERKKMKFLNEKRYSHKYKTITFDGDNRFKGIIFNLGNGDPKTVLVKQIIKIKSTDPYNNSESSQSKNVVNFDDYNGAFQSKDSLDSWVAYDFKNRKVKPTHYSIRSTNWGGQYHSHPQNWIIEGSNDFINWTLLDMRTNENSLDGCSYSNTFSIEKIKENDYFQYLRIRLNGKNTSNGIRLNFSALEYFGTIKEF